MLRAPSQLHTALRRTRPAFSLSELLVALAITALIVSAGVAMLTQWSTDNRTLPILAARQASDAQVQQMIGELRSAIAISYISANEVVATVDTNGASGLTPSVNDTLTGAYQVAYYF